MRLERVTYALAALVLSFTILHAFLPYTTNSELAKLQHMIYNDYADCTVREFGRVLDSLTGRFRDVNSWRNITPPELACQAYAHSDVTTPTFTHTGAACSANG